MEAPVTMSNKELDRLKVIHSVIKKHLTWDEAAAQLDLSNRQVGRLCVRVRKEGNKGIIHRLRGKPSNHLLDPVTVNIATAIVKERYADFGPTFANEKLLECHKIDISTSSLRKAMIEANIWKPRKSHPKHRQWRQRRSCIGELIQLDGSDHDWFEGRGPRCALLLFIDDASSKIIYAQFIPVENTFFLLSATKTYLLTHGRPVAFYVDKDSIYKINRQATIEEQLRDDQPISQFTRAMHELDINMIFAHSPQAKGRVERSFDTHQDRLVKELRLANISDMKNANTFLQNIYIPKHNAKFAVAPASNYNAHRSLLKSHNLDDILSVKTDRFIANDYTVRLRNTFLQVLHDKKIKVRPQSKIIAQIRLDNSIHLIFKGLELPFKTLPARPYKPFYAARPSALKNKSPIQQNTQAKPINYFGRYFTSTSKRLQNPTSSLNQLP
jgi:hypothetical protein